MYLNFSAWFMEKISIIWKEKDKITKQMELCRK